MKNNNPRKGFTLIEVLIVVSIIGLLSSAILVGLGGARARGRDARRISDLRQAQGALELYFSKTGSYPATAANWTDFSNSLTGAGIGVTKIANDPLTPARQYQYAASPDLQGYILMARLEYENPANNDVNGAIYGVDCTTATNYCVQY